MIRRSRNKLDRAALPTQAPQCLVFALSAAAGGIVHLADDQLEGLGVSGSRNRWSVAEDSGADIREEESPHTKPLKNALRPGEERGG